VHPVTGTAGHGFNQNALYDTHSCEPVALIRVIIPQTL
jgi:hypothetical protein